MKNLIAVIFAFFTVLVGFGGSAMAENELMLVIETNKGVIKAQLVPGKAPLTVANFVNLVQRGYYDGLKFHRVIPDFMVQTGDPLGNGSGGPGYTFEDEFDPSLKHDKPGVLSMANRGKATNGSQFFITHVPTPWLDNKHTIFGQVVNGQDVVNSIQMNDTMKRLTIEGDASALLAQNKDRIAQWDGVLDQKFPKKTVQAEK